MDNNNALPPCEQPGENKNETTINFVPDSEAPPENNFKNILQFIPYIVPSVLYDVLIRSKR
jgi:hypothetical protein